MNLNIVNIPESNFHNLLNILGISNCNYDVKNNLFTVDFNSTRLINLSINISSIDNSSNSECKESDRSVNNHIDDKPKLDTPEVTKIIKVNTQIKKVCRVCNNEFIAYSGKSKYCDECKRKYGNSVSSYVGLTKKMITKPTEEVKPVEVTKELNIPEVKVVSHNRKCMKCHKLLPVTEFEEGAFYCKKCVNKVQNAPTLSMSSDERTISAIFALPIESRSDAIDKLTSNQIEILLDRLSIDTDMDEAERKFAEEIKNRFSH